MMMHTRDKPCPGDRRLYDARGIYCGRCCARCESERRAEFRAEIFTNPNYETSEAIEND